MDTQRYIEALEKGDAPNAIVPLIVANARQEDRMRGYITGLRDALSTIENRVGTYADALASLRRTVESLEQFAGKGRTRDV